ncbi:MAG: Holliday junction branch migration protein RuvA [Planctomycetota bacterium]
MIARLTGLLEAVAEDRAVVTVGPVAVDVLVPAGDVAALEAQVGTEITLQTVCYLEGDASGGNLTPRLIGFATEADKGFFNAFITVKGIGPRKALRAMAIPPAEVAAAIEAKDTKALVQLPQIGKRAAETIIAELAGKVGRFVSPDAVIAPTPATSVGSLSPDEADAVDALVALGERRADAETLLSRVKKRDDAPEDANRLISEMLRLRGGR